MASPIVPISLSAPGFYGLNSQDSPTDMDPKFALDATNCVIDRSGRVASRKGWLAQHTTLAALGTSDVDALGELIDPAGASTIIAAGNNKVFKFTGTTLVELTYGGGGVAPAITASNWQMCSLGTAIVLFQIGHDPLIYDATISTSAYRRLSEHATYSGTVPLADCAISAYGRVWAARTTANKATVSWSDTSTFQKWTGGTAGSLDLTSVWPAGGDEIVALAAHNNSLIIFGRRQTLIYTGALTPSTMALGDTITGIGCVARDSVQMTGEDVIFLSDSGVRSISRTIQEKSAPMRTVSRNVNDDIQGYIGSVAAVDAKSVYSPADAIYLITFRTSGMTYCFDMRSPLQDGSARATVWTSINPRSYLSTKTRELLLGKAGYIGKYSEYTDNGTTYRMTYATAWMDFGKPMALSILKRIMMVILGAQDQSVVFKWGFDYNSGTNSETATLGSVTAAEYGVAEYGIGEYNANQIINLISIPASGSGNVVQVGFEAQLALNAISIQKIDVHTKEGRL